MGISTQEKHRTNVREWPCKVMYNNNIIFTTYETLWRWRDLGFKVTEI